jgi:hypothetical protein
MVRSDDDANHVGDAALADMFLVKFQHVRQSRDISLGGAARLAAKK